MYYIGIDLGTSAVKLLLMDETGSIANIVSREYPIAFPHPGWSEQDPDDWWAAVCDGIPALLDGFDASQVKGIGAGGQMHGLVVLDKNDTVIRPCILWNDGRTQRQVDYLNGVIGKDKLSRYTANIAFAGFTAPKLLWMRENEPDNFARIEKIMLPKDYINHKLTGVHCTDYSDASGMLLLDVEHKCWSKEMLDICGVQESKLPMLFESWQPVGTLTAEAAQMLGLPADVVVCAGAGDNAAAAVGCGAVGGGAKSPLWREILANVLGIPLTLPQTEQGPGYGGAMLAAVACGAYPSVQACAEALVHAKSTTQPDAALVEKYNARYAVWHKLYPALKVSFAEMEALQ